MLKRLILGLLIAAIPALAGGQALQNYIVPTAPPGTSNNQAASTAFVLGTAGVVTGGLITNNSPANLAAWTKSLNSMIKTGSHPRINMMGDSITFGAGSVLLKNSPTGVLASQLSARGLPATTSVFGMQLGTSAAVTTYEPRLVFTGTWGPWSDIAGGKTFRSTTAAGTETFTPGYSHDTADFYWLRGGLSGGGGMTITLLDGSNFSWSTFLAGGGGPIASGGPVNTVTISQASGTQNIMKTTLTYASAGSRAIVITNAGTGNIETYGIEAYTAATGNILIREMGNPGYTSTLLVSTGWLLGILSMPNELSILNIGRNDFGNGISTTTYAANLATLNSNMAANGGSIVYWTWPPSAISDTPTATQLLYINTMLAAAGTTIPVYNLWQRWENLGGQEALALAVAGYYNDGLHPSDFGNYELSQWLAKALLRDPQAGLN